MPVDPTTHEWRYPPGLFPNGADGHVGALTPKQSEQVAALLAALSVDPSLDLPRLARYDVTPQVFLVRHLRAHGWDGQEAEKAVRELQAWREEHQVDALLRLSARDVLLQDPEPLLAHFPHYVAGRDRWGRPVAWSLYGGFHLKRLLQHTSWPKVLRHHAWEMERLSALLLRLSLSSGRLVDRVTVVVDLLGFSLTALSSQLVHFLNEVAAMDKKYYADRAGQLLLINAPKALRAVYGRIRKMLDPEGAMEVSILSSEAEWGPRLRALVPEEELPVQYGGKGKDFEDLYAGGYEGPGSIEPPPERPAAPGPAGGGDRRPSSYRRASSRRERGGPVHPRPTTGAGWWQLLRTMVVFLRPLLQGPAGQAGSAPGPGE
mmetsp:Transcript_18467/g.61850  ORF Transcript_18467/g.61850 Transcript_18467/m.61850 type:complete len:375 (-) Transcript_18467:162-1286(-)